MRQIVRVPIRHVEQQAIEWPAGAVLAAVGVGPPGAGLHLWLDVPNIDAGTSTRFLRVFNSDSEIPDSAHHLATVESRDGATAWHVFDVGAVPA